MFRVMLMVRSRAITHQDRSLQTGEEIVQVKESQQMSLSTRVGLLAGASALTLTGVSVADTLAEVSTDARIAALEAEVSRLRGEGDLNEHRAAEIRAMVHDVLADADTRASLLSQGMTAGYDGGFMIGSNDGNFQLKMTGQVQARFVLNHVDDEALDGESETDWGVEMRRTKVQFAGHVVDPSWRYVVRGAFSSGEGTFDFEDSYIEKHLEGGWAVRVGQFKAPFLREELVSSGRQLAVERSLLNERYNQDYSRGVQVGMEQDQCRFMAMVNTGHGGGAGAWSELGGSRYGGALDADREIGLSARVEFLAAGNWNQFGDFISAPGSEYGAMIGGAIAYDHEGDGAGNNGDDSTVFAATIDATIKGDAWSLFAAGVYYGYDNGVSRDEMGVMVQGSYAFNTDWDVFARYEWADLDVDGAEELSVVTFGVNRYFAKHQVKWTTDIGFGLEEVNAGFSNSGAGWRTDPVGNDGWQVVFRSQLQLLF